MIQFCDSNGDFVGYSLASYAQVIDPVTCVTSYVLQAEYFDSDFVSQGSSLPAGWEKCCCEQTGSIVETVTTLIDTITGNKIGTYTNELGVSVDINETVTSLTYNAGTNELTFTDESGVATVVDLTALAVDINVASLTYNPVTGEIILTETDATVHTIDIGPPVSQFDIADGNLNTETVLGGDTITFLGDGVLLESVISATDTVTYQPIGGAPGDVLTTDAGGAVVWAPPGGGVEPALTDAFGFRPTEHTRSNRIVAQWASGIGVVTGSMNQIMIGDGTSAIGADYTGVLSGRANQITNGWSSFSTVNGGDANVSNGARYSSINGGRANNITNSSIIGYQGIFGGELNTFGRFGAPGDYGFIANGYNGDGSNSGYPLIGNGQNNRVGGAGYSGNFGAVVNGNDVRVAYYGTGSGSNVFLRGDYTIGHGKDIVGQAPYSAYFGLGHNGLSTDFTTNGGNIVAGSNHNHTAISGGNAIFGGQHSVNGNGNLLAGLTNNHNGSYGATIGEGIFTTGNNCFNFGSLVNTITANKSYSLASGCTINSDSSGIFASAGSTLNTGSDGSVILGGYQNGTLNAKYSLVHGWSSESFGFNGIALGSAKTYGIGSVAIGGNNDSGPTPGLGPISTGNYAVALGVTSQATSSQSFAVSGGVTSSGTVAEFAHGGSVGVTAVGFRGVAPATATTIPVATNATDVITTANAIRAALISQGLAI